jgi:hypothetical protein
MSRLDDAISNVAYILDSLMVLRNIYQTGHHCNDCGNRDCGYAPKPGQQIRYNCPLWRAKDDNTGND